ncbi:carbamoyl phosphate synthase small subunit [Siminovitchia acidinfaciens]|uniref:Carbamoyl phosphate synthase small chain n=1 Tax=Siminovitchia acidinfaciens TaxID=2321395 RepID=A0A429Y2F6_9BACI|nr:carbamoyl phosphate synthase small subunit [Siminovitchia acidinfaciens]RST75429.1 carbamoyl phosphate synthase small subunit [Siminovitchia acidinfaciens]
MKRQLILEDGTIFVGEAIGSEKETTGEIIFNTSMTGYQEIISDPSNYGQIIAFGFPQIGNYGINRDDFESIDPVIKGVIVKEAADFPSNWRSNMSFGEFLKAKDIPGITGIDTRKLIRLIRTKGTMKGVICGFGESIETHLSRLHAIESLADQVKQVSTVKPFPAPGRGSSVIVMDFGLKHGILRELTKRGCDVTVVPYNTSAKEILSLQPDGLILSNGPGNPEDVPEAVETIRSIQGKVPLFGIGLGHQLFALANDCKTQKMFTGHRGGSYPVKDIETGRVIFTSQNHGYEVVTDSVDESKLSITHVQLNDGSNEGLAHKEHSAFSVQFEPEAAPGSEDAKYLFDQFLKLMDVNKRKADDHAKKN